MKFDFINFASVAGIIGFFISIYNFLYNFRYNKAKVNLIYKGCHFLRNVSDMPLAFHLILENESHLDVSVSRMYLVIDGNKYEFTGLPHQVYFMKNGQSKEIIYSKELPVFIPGLGACGGHFCVDTFESPEIISNFQKSKNVKVLIKTNRKFKKTFPIPNKIDNLKPHP